MNKHACCPALLFFFFLNIFSLQAQDPRIPTPESIINQSKNQKFITKIGFDIGVGTSEMNLQELNQRLADAKIGWLDELLTTFNVNVYAELKNAVGVSMDYSLGVSQDGKMYQLNTFLNFTTSSFGPTVYVPLFRTKRIFLWATGGLRSVRMNLKYNAVQNNAANFNLLLNNPGANSSSFHIYSGLNENALFGGRFQFRFEKGYQERSPDFRVGIDAGYAHCFRYSPWSEIGSKQIIANMPAVRPDNVYFNINFSGYF